MTEYSFLHSTGDVAPIGLEFTEWEGEQASALGQIATDHSHNQLSFAKPIPSPSRNSSDQQIGRDPITGKTLGTITFTRFDGTNGHIFSVRPDGSHEQQFTRQPGVQAHSNVSRSGRFLVYTQVDAHGSRVELVRLGKSTASTKPKNISGSLTWSMVPDFSPNSRRIAFTSNNDGNYEIYSVDRNGSQLRQLTFGNMPVQHVGPKYSPNEKLLMFASDREEPDPNNQQNLWTMATDGGPMQRLTQGLNNRESRSWSPDGLRIVSQTVIAGVGQIVVMDADGQNQRQITNISNTTPTFSPGGFFQTCVEL